MKTIGLIADTHIPTRCKVLPPQVCSVFADTDLILHAGDVVTPEILNQLQALAPVSAVAGNHDRKKQRFSPPLPTKELFSIEGYNIGLIHGDSQSGAYRHIWERAYRAFGRNPVDIIVYGHTHNPMLQSDGSKILINPGSAGYSRSFKQSSFCTMTLYPEGIRIEYFYFEANSTEIAFSSIINFQPGKLPLTFREQRRLYF